MIDYGYNFSSKKEKRKKKIIFVVIFLIVVIAFTSIFFRKSNNNVIRSVSNVISYPFVFIYDSVTGIFSNIGDKFANTKKLTEENENLNSKIKELEAQVLESQRILDENTSLKKMLSINTVYQHFKLKYASIVVREHDNWTQTFVINIGEKDGVKLNQAVVHADGLVGYISSVNENTSVVTTILDQMASVSVNISTINEPAILKGDLNLKSNNKLKLEYIPIGAQVSVGDMLYTSGLGSTYPSGIPVAKIEEVVNDKNDIDRYAVATTCVNIRTISEVGVITDY